MIECIPGIYQFTLYDSANNMNEIQIFLIRGSLGKRSLMIDAGFQNQESMQIMEKALHNLDISYSDLDVFLTHKHHDHTGLARFLSQKGAKIFMNPEEDRHPYDCLYYSRNQKALDEQVRVLRTVGVTKEKTPKLWTSFMALNEALKMPEKSGFFGGKPYPYDPITEGQIFSYGSYTFQAILLRGHTFGQMGLYDKEHKLVFSADQIIDGIVPIVATAYMNEHLLRFYFQSLTNFKKQYQGCLVYPAHNASFTDSASIIETILSAYQGKLDLIRQILAFSTKPMTIQETAFLAYGIQPFSPMESEETIIKIKMILTKTFSCLEYLHDKGEISRSDKDGVLYWTKQ